VHTAVLNPKSIKMGELYGEYNHLTNEWQDGLASSIIRTYVAHSDSEDRRWVVFDGPVDAVWVENMNTGGFKGSDLICVDTFLDEAYPWNTHHATFLACPVKSAKSVLH